VNLTGASLVFLGVIAVATLVMAVVQIGVIVVAARLASRVDKLADQLDREIKPVLANFSQVGQNAARASSLAVAQVERADKLLENLTRRMDETMKVVQDAVIAPAREGRAVVVALRTAVTAFRELRAARARAMRHEDEDALFIG
jgi:hypothetical protein